MFKDSGVSNLGRGAGRVGATIAKFAVKNAGLSVHWAGNRWRQRGIDSEFVHGTAVGKRTQLTDQHLTVAKVRIVLVQRRIATDGNERKREY